ncbi:hypothetical protein BBP40_008482 [Aspergillus hancockii]|nr:hypothetical protein BBP40_008482 [Aspergillus hancockii]
MLPDAFINIFFKEYHPMNNEATLNLNLTLLHQLPKTTNTTQTKPTNKTKHKTPPTQPPQRPTKRQNQESKILAFHHKLTHQQTFHLTPPTTFHGTLIAQKHPEAIAHALTTHDTPPNTTMHVFWADASCANGASGAAIAYKLPANNNEWLDRGYTVTDLCGDRMVDVSELFAVGAAMRVALVRIGKMGDGEGERHVVRVFTDSMGALLVVWRFAMGVVSARTVAGRVTGYVCDISRQLGKMGVKVEACWVPGKPGVPIPGHKRADLLSRAAARSWVHFEKRDMGCSVDGVIEVVRSDYLEVLLRDELAFV